MLGAQGYGGQPYGAMQQGYAQAFVAGVAPGTPKPTVRNAVMTLLVPIVGYVVAIALFVVGAILGDVLLMICALAGGLVILAAAVIIVVSAIRMLGELRSLTKSPVLAWWALFVPIYSLYVMLLVVPSEMRKAKQMVNAQQPPRNIIIYFFLWPYAMAADLNDVARAMPG
jgi:hypothetical protein